MTSLFSHNMIFITGKGGVGKTTLALGVALEAAAQGHRTIVCEVGEHRRAPEILGVAAGADGAETQIADGLWSTSISPRRALEEWLSQQVGSRSLMQVLTKSNAFQYFVAAAPGTDELVTMTKVWELTQDERWSRRAEDPYDVVVVDAPASGHGLALLAAPATFASVARVGPIAKQAGRVDAFLKDPHRAAYVAVTLAAELPVTETVELQAALAEQLGRPLDAVLANQVLPRRFAAADLERVGAARGRPRVSTAPARAARSQAAQVVEQQAQLRRLRREARAPVHTLPFVVTERLGLEDVRRLGRSATRAVA